MKTHPAPGLSGIAPDTNPLLLDLLEWLAIRPRPYSEAMEVWRTSCPRLTIWEDAVDLGYLVRRRDDAGEPPFVIFDAGRAAGASVEGRVMSDWSPATYLKFENERTRPAADLLARVPLETVRQVVDVGCGPGNSTELLAMRYPGADILGLDNSPAMLEEARRRLPALRFEAGDAAMWLPGAQTDLVFANATYQWIPNHFSQLPHVLKALRPGSVLAVQMPDNVEQTTHRLMREVAKSGPWAEHLRGASRAPLPPPSAYYEALQPHAARLDIWHTVYNHPLASAAAIVEFVRSTGLRPFVDPLDEPQRTEFLARYTAAIAAAYPVMADGKVLLGFKRLFIVAQR